LKVRLCTRKNKAIPAIPATAMEANKGREKSVLLHFLDNRLTDGGEAVGRKR
jgi:hypothetical protein